MEKKNPIGRPKKPEAEQRVMIWVSIKRKHKKEVQSIIDNIKKAYQ